jgi:hypothetical protein
MSLGRVMSPTMISTERDLRESMKGDLVKRVFADVCGGEEGSVARKSLASFVWSERRSKHPVGIL